MAEIENEIENWELKEYLELHNAHGGLIAQFHRAEYYKKKYEKEKEELESEKLLKEAFKESDKEMNNKYKKEKREHETTMEALKKWEDMDYEDLTILANELYEKRNQ